MKRIIMIVMSIVVSCTQIVKPGLQKEYQIIYKNLTNAESIENPVQKEKLLNNAYNLLSQMQAQISKEKKSNSSLMALLSYYYFLKGNYQDAMAQIELAQSLSTSNDPLVVIMQSRLLLASKGKAAAQQAIDNLAQLDGDDHPMAYITKGDALFLKAEYEKARESYKKALMLNRELQVVAANRIELVAKIKSLNINIAKVSDFILQPVVTRDKIAYLMYEIFELQKYVTTTKTLTADFMDINKTPYSNAIVSLRNRGFFSYIEGNMFEPFLVVSRGEMARIVEDFIVLSKNNEGLRTKFKNESNSFFNDIQPDNPYYNALRLAVDMGIMNVSLSQDAYPDESVTGLQAIMILQKLVK